mmetsp:Transcript_4866/g.13827  ORF Transcript_4866/g.13827 Transcript_4866/m.13827 type:complete len:225 (+) Transcript_4866:544-1218(+)
MNPHSVYNPRRNSSDLRMNVADTANVTNMNDTVLATSRGPGNAVAANSAAACSRNGFRPVGSIFSISSSVNSSSGLYMMGFFSGSVNTLMSRVGSELCCNRARFSAALIASAVATLFSMLRSAARARILSFILVNSPERELKAASSSASIEAVRSICMAASSSSIDLVDSSKDLAPPGPSFSSAMRDTVRGTRAALGRGANPSATRAADAAARTRRMDDDRVMI